ncbi:hypothetical protein ZEAMMB73_Zm00001d022435 [Zea mays]|uniref:Enhanced disease resistance 4-like N-terminal domain-containing protein n=1 Tax=Zea mays TaxID=4577 RepID=A0A1D6IMT0_MAIZE|nr:hypothetical protein ZEAMMB73_Zm00001d022435 [Zea mays]
MPMENSVRRVRCPRCHSVLEEPSAPVYQCGGCGTSLRAKNRTGTGTGSTGDAAGASPARSWLPPQSRHLDASDVASTSRSSTPTPPRVASTSRSGTPTPPDVGTSWHRDTDATGTRHGSGDLALVSAGTRGSGDVASTSSTPVATARSRRRQGTDATSRGSGDVASTSSTPDTTARIRRQDTDATTRGSGDVASTSSTPDASADTTRRGESGGPVPARNRVPEQAAAALIEKRGREQSAAGQEVRDDSEGRGTRDASGAESGVGGVGFSGGNRDATPELQDDTEKGMKRHDESNDAARKERRGEAAEQPRYDHDRRQELAPKSSAQPAAAQLAREDEAATAGEKAPSPSRHEVQEEHLRPLRKKILKTVDELKGDLSELFSKSPELNAPRARPPRLPRQEAYVSHAVAGAASGLPARARHVASAAEGDQRSDPFAPFIDGFGLSSYSTEDERRLPVSRNTSFDTLDGTKGVGRLHRLMGYGSASELLRHSPDLYESFSERTTPDVRQHDTKGKGVCIDDDDYDYDLDDTDDEDIGALKRSARKGSGWTLPWIPGKRQGDSGAIRIK